MIVTRGLGLPAASLAAFGLGLWPGSAPGMPLAPFHVALSLPAYGPADHALGAGETLRRSLGIYAVDRSLSIPADPSRVLSGASTRNRSVALPATVQPATHGASAPHRTVGAPAAVKRAASVFSSSHSIKS